MIKLIIKYSSRMNEKLRVLYKNELLDCDLDKTGLVKSRGVSSAVQIKIF